MFDEVALFLCSPTFPWLITRRSPNKNISSLTLCFCCSQHGRSDTGVSGVQDVAGLVLQHRGGPELRGPAVTGTKLHSVHRGLPASARSVKRINGATAAKTVSPFAKPASHNSSLFLSHFSEVGRSRQVQREHDQTVLIRLQSSSATAQMIISGLYRITGGI